MIRKTARVIDCAEENVKRLVEECRKYGALYVQNPQAVAHVSRTGKWLLNAIARVRRELKISSSSRCAS